MTHDFAGTSHDLTLGYSYNPASQIVSTTRSNDLYAWTGHGSGTSGSPANGLNQLTAIGGSSIAHDAKGNVANDPTIGYGYAYSAENLLTTVGTPYYQGWLNYDGLNRLTAAGAGPSTQYFYDGNSRVAEYQEYEEVARYVFGPGEDEPLVSYENSGSGYGLNQVTYLHADERGSIIATSTNGQVTAIGRYDEYGRTQSFGGNRFGFAGMPYETVSDLYYARARMYNPRHPRFMQPDPIGYGDGMNMYAYVGGDPVNFTDTSGLSATSGCDRSGLGANEALVCGERPKPQPQPGLSPAFDGISPGASDPCKGTSLPDSLQCGGGGGGAPSPQPQPQKEGDSTEIVVTAKRSDLKQCLMAVGRSGLEAFIDPLSIAAGAGKSIYKARERIGDGDYGRRRDGTRFPRDWRHAARLGLRRFVPGYLQVYFRRS